MTAEPLTARTCKELASLAKQHGIAGRSRMCKRELIAAVRRALFSQRSRNNGRRRAIGDSSAGNAATKKTKSAARRRSPTSGKRRSAARADDVSHNGNGQPPRSHPPRSHLSGASHSTARKPSGDDVLVARLHDAYWVDLRWRLTERAFERAAAALGAGWRRAVPVIRIYERRLRETAADSEICAGDVAVTSQADHWFVPVRHPGRTYRFEIGYRTDDGRFFSLARSNSVRAAAAGGDSLIAENHLETAADVECAGGQTPLTRREVRDLRALTRGSSTSRRHSPGVNGCGVRLETELLVRGQAQPGSEVTLDGRPVKLAADGTFKLPVPVLEGRQIVPVRTLARDSDQVRTVLLAIERNTKALEPRAVDDPIV